MSMKQPLGTLYREVWRTERQLTDDRGTYHQVGHDGWPDKELVRFRTSQHMGYAGRDVVARHVQRRPDGRQVVELTVDCMGLTGARGALPAHYSELVLAQLKQKSPAMRDFFDLFNHRLVSLFYRSWEKTQPAVHQERDGEDVFTRMLKALTGASEHWELYYGGAFSRGTRSASTLQSVLADLAGMPVRVRTLQGGWAPVALDDQSRLPGRGNPEGQYARLGDAMLGSKAWMADKGASIVFYPANGQQLRRILPGGSHSPALGQISRVLVPATTQVRYRLVARRGDLPGSQLGQQGRLGSDAFISARTTTDKTIEVSFRPGGSHQRQGKE
ncbi:type VI secretion system baseplate subunit TssG [Rheinheimera sp. NSM]|uniref:type VI secretion system baseplate subunit TssG n=1 Tax=Rheinheimera sp. NSM TaxID=3457884 RepID=UPI004034F7FD